MDKLHQLFIRACKSEKPMQRVMSVHRRFYCGYKDNSEANKLVVAGILSELVDKYNPYESSYKLMSELFPYNDDRTPQTKAFNAMVYRLRFMKKSEHGLIGLTSPLRFRLKEKV